MVNSRTLPLIIALSLMVFSSTVRAEEYVCAAVVPQCQGKVAVLPDREENPCSVSYDKTCSAIYSASRQFCQGIRRTIENERKKNHPKAAKKAEQAYRDCLKKIAAN